MRLVARKKRRPRVVDDMLTLERRYAASASRLQQWWRACMRRSFWKPYFRKVQACVQIQRMARGMQARAGVAILLRDRETKNRQELMRVLEVEEEWHRVQRDKVQKRLERLACELEEQCYRSHEKISDVESIYLDMQTQRLRVSPRAIKQGWVEEMEEKVKLQHAAITQLKLDTIFKIGLEFKQKEQSLLESQQRIRDLEEKRRKFEIWREDEFLDYWERECLFQHKLKIVEKRRRVADQRRKWTIKRCHNNRKPDRRWKCGRWGDEVLEQAKKKEIFCVANADLLATIQSKWRKHLEGDKLKSDDVEDTIQEVDDLANQVALVATQAQIKQTKAIFDPVFQDIEKSYLQVQNQQHKHDKKREAVRTRELKLRSLLANEKNNTSTKQTSGKPGEKE